MSWTGNRRRRPPLAPRRTGKDAAAVDLAQHGGVSQPDGVPGLDGRNQDIGITLKRQVAIWAPGLPYPSEALQQRAVAQRWAESGRNSVLILLAVTYRQLAAAQPALMLDQRPRCRHFGAFRISTRANLRLKIRLHAQRQGQELAEAQAAVAVGEVTG